MKLKHRNTERPSHPAARSETGREGGNGKRLQARLRILQVALIFLFGIVCVRLAQIQIFESSRYRKIAQRQYQSKVALPATRGSLYDRNENVIASNSMYVSFAADPKLAAEDAKVIATKFSQLFGKPKSYYLQKLRSDSRFVWLERQVSANYLKKIDVKRLEGVVISYEPKRLYYNDHVAGQLIGCTNIDNVGLAGLELAFEKELKGSDGYVVFQRDGLGRARPTVDYPRVEPVNGHNIYLTIDMRLQAIAEKELKHGIEASQAERGIVVMLQPKTGEVLALAQYPSIDPNSFGKHKLEDQKLRAVTDVFEPGSVFKIVTASAALEHHLVSPQQKFFAENGEYTLPVSRGKARTIRDTHKEGWITFEDAMAVSSNIVMAKISDIIGSEKFYTMARNYGFGIATNIEFPGEVKGMLKKPVEWSGTTLNTIAYGYEIGATPLQIAAAYCAVANGGILMKPFLFRKEVEATGQLVREAESQAIRRVISEATARTLTRFFEGVVDHGTGETAKINGVRIAGKTGTSKKIIEGRYETGSYTASFVGFFPVENPQVVCLVMMDNPRGINYTGGTTSAPVFRAIAEQILTTTDLIIPPSSTEEEEKLPIAASSKKDAATQKSAQKANTGKQVAVNATPQKGQVPDVTGFTVRKAINILASQKLEPVVKGSGIVISQKPEAGEPSAKGMKVVLICQPKSLTSLAIPSKVIQ